MDLQVGGGIHDPKGQHRPLLEKEDGKGIDDDAKPQPAALLRV